MNVGKIAFQVENERLLEKLRATGVPVYSFDGWKLRGLFVRRGERQRTYRVQSGVVHVGIDPITGEDVFRPMFKTAYGFHASQVDE